MKGGGGGGMNRGVVLEKDASLVLSKFKEMC